MIEGHAPIPEDFAPRITRESVRGGVVFVWRDTIVVAGVPVQLEYGIRHEDREHLRAKAWEMLEHARLGNHAEIEHVRADRHSKRPRLRH